MKKAIWLLVFIPIMADAQYKPLTYSNEMFENHRNSISELYRYMSSPVTNPVFFLNAERTDTFATLSSTWSSSDSLQLNYYFVDSTLASEIHLVNDVDSGWIDYTGIYYYYDGNRNDTSIIFRLWDDDLKVWNNESKLTYTYDANKNVLTNTYLVWDSTKYENASLFLYQYNPDNKVTKFTSLNWDGATQQWDSSQQSIFTYNADNNVINETDYVFLGASFAPTTQYLTYYNGQNLDTAVIGQLWTGTKWANNFRDSSAYDVNNQKILAERLGYDSKSKTFIYTQSRIEYQYSSAGQLAMEKNYVGDGNVSFIPIGTTTYSYDANGNNNYVLSQIYDAATQNYINYEQDIFYYSSILSGIPVFSRYEPSIVLSPNPSGGMLNVEMNLLQQAPVELQVLNLQGVILSDSKHQLSQGASSIQLNVSNLTKGTYFLRLINLVSHEQNSFPFIRQ